MKKICGAVSAVIVLLAIGAYFFRGHIYFAADGYVVVLSSPQASDDEYGYRYDMLVNGDSIQVNIQGFYGPVQLQSGRLGSLKVYVLQDIKNGVKRIQDSDDMEAVQASKYSVRQLNLVYRYFDHHYSKNKVLVIPNYKERTHVILRLFAALAWAVCVPVIGLRRMEGKRERIGRNVILVTGTLAVLYLTCGEFVTIL